MKGHLRADVLAQLSRCPVWRFDLAVQQQVLLGGHMVKEDIVLHADPQFFANSINVCLHVFAVDVYGTGWRCKKASEERPASRKS